MERLTAKFDNKRIMGETFNGYYDNAKNVSDESRKAILDKLGKLEDLEEKIGMPIIELFDAMNDKKIWGISAEFMCISKSPMTVFGIKNLWDKWYLCGEYEGGSQVVPIDKIGELFFFTRMEAEKRLEELKNGK